MPKITIPADATNYSLYARLKLVRATETPNFMQSCAIQTEVNASSDDLKVGDRSMTSADYDELIAAGDSAPVRAGGALVLSEVFVRNDGTNTINAHLKYTPM